MFVFAGKAHPADEPGQCDDARDPAHLEPAAVHRRDSALEGYDIGIGRLLTSGVDVWLNTPIHPFEASGTSGMKAAINGTVNLSVLDGWWAEAYDGANGWGIPPSIEDHGSGERDRQDAQTLYEILQDEVVPLYYAQRRESSATRLAGCRSASAPWRRRCRASTVSASSKTMHATSMRLRLSAAAPCVADDLLAAHGLAAWKRTVRTGLAWCRGQRCESARDAGRVRCARHARDRGQAERAATRGLRVECVLSPRALLGDRRGRRAVLATHAQRRRGHRADRPTRRPSSPLFKPCGSAEGEQAPLPARAAAAVGRRDVLRHSRRALPRRRSRTRTRWA